MLGIQVNAKTGAFALVFLAGSVAVSLFLIVNVPLDTLATPTQVTQDEFIGVAAFFLVSVSLAEPAKAFFDRRMAPLSRLLQSQAKVPAPIRVVALLVVAWGAFAFFFWAIACCLGGYNGYNYAFSAYPFLPLIYNHTIGLVPYLSQRDKGTQASFWLGVGALGLIVFRANRGIGTAVKDTLTLFVAPAIILYELGLWYSAPEDMTWHVTDYLYYGGVADNGWRSFDHGAYLPYTPSLPFIVSNWFVLFVCLFMVAYRIPWIYTAAASLKESMASPEPRP